MTSKLRKIATTTHPMKYAPDAAPGLPDAALTSDPIPHDDYKEGPAGTSNTPAKRSTVASPIK